MQNVCHRGYEVSGFSQCVTQVTKSCLVGDVLQPQLGVESRHADIAQLVEQLICNQQVGGSSPSIGSTVYRDNKRLGGSLRRHIMLGEIAVQGSRPERI